MKLEQKDIEILRPLIENTIQKALAEKENKEFEKKIFNITQTAELIGKSYNFVSNLIKEGYLETTADGKHVSGKEINKYLNLNNDNNEK